jgi:hypothetical protein
MTAVESSIYFLERSELWKTEKPFVLDYVPEPPAVKSNASVADKPVVIEDIRGRESQFTYAENGFCLLPLDHGMEPADFDDDAKVRDVYLRNVGDALKTTLRASRVQIYDYIVRKREAQFPLSTGKFYSHKQPSSIAHVGKLHFVPQPDANSTPVPADRKAFHSRHDTNLHGRDAGHAEPN